MISLVGWLFVTLTLAAPRAFPEAPNSREEALAALQSPDAAIRAEGVVWIARSGTADDASPLYERLRDESALVRSYAEQALWLVWSRSGDAAVDRPMERGTEEMQAGRPRQALATFSEGIRRQPGFAQGWNQRATVLYLARPFLRFPADLDALLKP